MAIKKTKKTKRTRRTRTRRRKQNKKTRVQKQQDKFPYKYGHVYLETCPACQNMQPEWDILTLQVPNEKLVDIKDDYKLNIDNFNTENKTNLNFEYFPTIWKLRNQGDNVVYYDNNQPRTAIAMKKWLLSK